MAYFLKFLKEKKVLVVFSIIFVALIYGYRLINPTIGVDTEAAIAGYRETLNCFLGNGRFFCAALRKILMPNGFDYYLAFVLAIIFLNVAQLIILCAFHRYGLTNNVSLLIFSILFLSFPIFAEVFYFANQVDVIAIGLLLSTLGALLICNYVLYKKPFKYLLFGIILGGLATGAYQAFFYLFIAEILTLSILYVYTSDTVESLKQYLKYAFQLILAIIATAVFYFVTSTLIREIFFQPELLYSGQWNSKEYISSTIAWKNASVVECLINVIKYGIETIQIDSTFSGFCFFVIFLLNLVFIICAGNKEKRQKKVYLILLFIALATTPYLGALVKGSALNIREQFMIPFIFAFTAAFLYDSLKNTRYFKHLYLVIMILISWNHVLTTLSLFNTDYLRYQFDYSTALHITQTAEEKYGTLDDKVIVYSGMKTWDIPEGSPYGDVIGFSIFQWDYRTEGGVNYRVNHFSKSLGLTQNIPTMDQIQTGYQLAAGLEVWPSANATTISDNIIVVKLSE